MNNIELAEKFQELSLVANPFDLAIELKNFKKEYKKSDFYKRTHMPLQKAYGLYIKSSGAYLVNFITQVIEHPSKLTKILSDAIDGLDPTYLQTLMDKVVDTVSLDELKDLQGQLKEATDSFKRPL